MRLLARGIEGILRRHRKTRRQAMHSDPGWAGSAQQFQQQLTDNWTKAMRALGGIEAPGAAPGAPVNPIQFSPEKLAALQQAYLQEAAQLWNHGLAGVAAGDKRFSSEEWGRNPIAAFSAAA